MNEARRHRAFATTSRARSAAPWLRALAALAAVGGCAAGSSPPAGGGGGATPMTSGTVTAQSFAINCAGCHGPDGAGSALAPQILDPVAEYATYVVRTGRQQMGYPQAMPAFAEDVLTDGDLADILAWLDQAPKPADGEGLFLRFCANCHGSDGLGGRVGKNIVEEASEGAGEILEDVRKGHGGTAYGSRYDYMPAWPSAKLTDAEVEAIADYLATLPGGGGGGGDDD